MKQLILILSCWFCGSTFAQDSVFSFKMKLTGHTKFLETVKYSPDGKYLATGGYDGDLKMFKADTPMIGKLVENLTGHLTCITSIAFSTDGTLVGSGSKDNSVRVYNVESGELIFSTTEHSDGVTKVDFVTKGQKAKH